MEKLIEFMQAMREEANKVDDKDTVVELYQLIERLKAGTIPVDVAATIFYRERIGKYMGE
jgi:hypothetical protein